MPSTWKLPTSHGDCGVNTECGCRMRSDLGHGEASRDIAGYAQHPRFPLCVKPISASPTSSSWQARFVVEGPLIPQRLLYASTQQKANNRVLG